MSCHTAFLAVALGDDLRQWLDTVATAIQAAPAEMLGVPGVSFDPIETSCLHMTFIFFGSHLRELPAAQLVALHAAVAREVAAAGQAAAAPLVFQGFELFPPQKCNLVVARFAAPRALLELREAVLAACKVHGVALPASLWSLLEREGAWSPHATLGKIGASRARVGGCSCRGLARSLPAAPAGARPLGLTLLGERPKRAWCDWDDALAFQAPDAAEEEPPLASEGAEGA
mmetsp:Transcript_64103/g.181996  ORF Transcript_64103/g.181996 Transcript_64103/m.181996 type:complete len:230 (+) Transcript_64103:67-756(+)